MYHNNPCKGDTGGVRIRGEGDVMTEAKVAVIPFEDGGMWEAEEGEETNLPLECSGRSSAAGNLILAQWNWLWTSDLQNCRRIKLLCFKATKFVGNFCRSHRKLIQTETLYTVPLKKLRYYTHFRLLCNRLSQTWWLKMHIYHLCFIHQHSGLTQLDPLLSVSWSCREGVCKGWASLLWLGILSQALVVVGRVHFLAGCGLMVSWRVLFLLYLTSRPSFKRLLWLSQGHSG